MLQQSNIILDFGKVAYVASWWENQDGTSVMKEKPTKITVRGESLVDGYAFSHQSFPLETVEERARRLGIIDTWTFHIRFQLSNSHRICYRGKKAERMHAAYRSYLFSKGQQRKGKHATNRSTDKNH